MVNKCSKIARHLAGEFQTADLETMSETKTLATYYKALEITMLLIFNFSKMPWHSNTAHKLKWISEIDIRTGPSLTIHSFLSVPNPEKR